MDRQAIKEALQRRDQALDQVEAEQIREAARMSPSERAEITIALSDLCWTEPESFVSEIPQKWARWAALGKAWKKRMNESA